MGIIKGAQIRVQNGWNTTRILNFGKTHRVSDTEGIKRIVMMNCYTGSDHKGVGLSSVLGISLETTGLLSRSRVATCLHSPVQTAKLFCASSSKSSEF
jgi:hypothetical protein